MSAPRKLGELVAIPIKGRKLLNRSGGKQSPYVQLKLSDQKKRTRASLISTVEPEWDQEVHLDVFQGQLDMQVSVYDEGRKNELIGEGVLLLHEVIDKGELDVWFPIKAKGAHAGDVYFELTFYAVAPPPGATPPTSHAGIPGQVGRPPVPVGGGPHAGFPGRPLPPAPFGMQAGGSPGPFGPGPGGPGIHTPPLGGFNTPPPGAFNSPRPFAPGPPGGMQPQYPNQPPGHFGGGPGRPNHSPSPGPSGPGFTPGPGFPGPGGPGGPPGGPNFRPNAPYPANNNPPFPGNSNPPFPPQSGSGGPGGPFGGAPSGGNPGFPNMPQPQHFPGGGGMNTGYSPHSNNMNGLPPQFPGAPGLGGGGPGGPSNFPGMPIPSPHNPTSHQQPYPLANNNLRPNAPPGSGPAPVTPMMQYNYSLESFP